MKPYRLAMCASSQLCASTNLTCTHVLVVWCVQVRGRVTLSPVAVDQYGKPLGSDTARPDLNLRVTSTVCRSVLNVDQHEIEVAPCTVCVLSRTRHIETTSSHRTT